MNLFAALRNAAPTIPNASVGVVVSLEAKGFQSQFHWRLSILRSLGQASAQLGRQQRPRRKQRDETFRGWWVIHSVCQYRKGSDQMLKATHMEDKGGASRIHEAVLDGRENLVFPLWQELCQRCRKFGRRKLPASNVVPVWYD